MGGPRVSRAVATLTLTLSLVAMGCVDGATVDCADGRVCPAGTVCDTAHGTCVLPDQLERCVGDADGTICTIGVGGEGICVDQVCVPRGCGDEFVLGTEECDGADLGDAGDCTDLGYHEPGALACADDCSYDESGCTAICGDGTRNGDEACDNTDLGEVANCNEVGFYDDVTIGCTPACTYDVSDCTGFCGDGVANGPEQCDGADLDGLTDGCEGLGYYNAGTVTCGGDCRYDVTACSGVCGDGTIDPQESCDDANLGGVNCEAFGYYGTAGLTCTSACTFDDAGCEPNGYCGDGVKNGDEDCDDLAFGGASCQSLGFYDVDTLACDDRCAFDDSGCAGFCGDRAPNGAESCDGRRESGDSCLDFGFDDGDLGCLGLCGPDFADCRQRGEWLPMSYDASDNLLTLWGTGPGDIYAAGCLANEILHFDGGTWSPMATPIDSCLWGLWGAASDDVYAVGDYGVVLHYDGTSWAEPSTGITAHLTSVFGFASDDVYVGGDNGYVGRWDGSTWETVVTTGTSEEVFGIWGSAPDDLFISANGGTMLHYDGSTWTDTFLGHNARVYDVWGAGPDDVFAIDDWPSIFHYDGTSWSVMLDDTEFPNPTQKLWGTSGSDVYTVGEAGAALHYDGSSWSLVAAGTSAWIADVWGTGPGQVFVAIADVPGKVLQLDDRRWGQFHTGGIGSTSHSIFSFGSDSTFARAGSRDWMFHDGHDWTSLPQQLPGVLGAFWGAAPDDLWAAGSDISHYDGSSWTTTIVSGSFGSIFGTADDDIFAVGPSGAIRHYNGTSWGGMSSGTSSWLRDVWASGPADVFVVGNGGTIRHYDGTSWTGMTSGVGVDLYTVYGAGPNYVLAAGNEGTVIRYDGTGWSPMSIDATNRLRAMWVASPIEAYVAGEDTGVWKFDGARWSPMRLPLDALYFYSLHGSTTGDLFAGGSGFRMRLPRTCLPAEKACGDNRDDDCDGLQDCNDPDCNGDAACPDGGLCADWQTLTCDTSVPGSTNAGFQRLHRYACSDWLTAAPEVIYKLVPDTAGTVTVTLDDLTRDLDLIVLTEGPGGGCDPLITGCLGASSTTGTEQVTFEAEASATYYVVVDGMATELGNFTLSADCPP